MSNKIMAAVVGGTVAGAGAVGVVAMMMWRAYVLTVLWSWFIVATFAVPALSVPAAIGLFITVAMFRNRKKENSADEKESIGEQLAIQALIPLLLLGMGWIVKMFMA